MARLLECCAGRDDIVPFHVGNTHLAPPAAARLEAVHDAKSGAGDDLLVLSPYWPMIRGVAAVAGVGIAEMPSPEALGGGDAEDAVAERVARDISRHASFARLCFSAVPLETLGAGIDGLNRTLHARD